MWLKIKGKQAVRGFTLIEMLVSLFVTSLILFALLACINVYQRAYAAVQEDRTLEWYQFHERLSHELARYDLIDVEAKRIIIKEKTSNRQFRIIHRGNKIYKEIGHHPYLYGVNDWQLAYDNPVLYINVVFSNGQSFSGQVVLEEGRVMDEEE